MATTQQENKDSREAGNRRSLALVSDPAMYPQPTIKRFGKVVTDDPFWGDQPSILLNTSRLLEFYPSADYTLEERMNSVTRLVLYVGFFLSVYHKQLGALQVAGLAMAAIYAMWRTQTIVREEAFNGQMACTSPSLENPMANFLPLDPADKPPACEGPEVQADAAQLLEYQLYEDVDDLYARRGSQRQFVTNPVTGKIPDTTKLASWLYGGMQTCKGDGYCPPYTDLRAQRQLLPEDVDASRIVI